MVPGEVPAPYSGEDIPIRQLWVPGASVEALLRWMNDATPGYLVRVSPDSFSARLTLNEFGACLSTPADEGWLHELAARAAEDGVASLTIDGVSLSAAAPFYAFTERRPGVAQRTLWFDPLRGVSDSEVEMGRVLSRYRGHRVDFEHFIFERERVDGFDGSFVVPSDGGPVEFRPWNAPGPAALTVVDVVAFLLIAPLPMVITWILLANVERPPTLGAAMAPASLGMMLAVPLLLFPGSTPGGREIPLPLRMLWFLGSPAAFGALWFTQGWG